MELITEALPQYAPTSNLYRLADGQHVVITQPVDAMPLPPGLAILGTVKIDRIEPGPTEVFLADEHARLVDADGDPTNGMTALLRLDPGTTFDEAVAAAESELA